MKIKEKEWYKGLTSLRGQKPCKKIRGRRQKFALNPWPIEQRENRVWKVLKKWWTRENSKFFFKKKTLYAIFDW